MLFVSIFRMQGAFLPGVNRSPVSAGARGNLEMAAAAKQMRRIPAPTRNTVRRGVLAAPYVAGKANVAWGDDDFESGLAYRRAKGNLARMERDGGQRRKSGKAEWRRETLNGINPNTGERNRC